MMRVVHFQHELTPLPKKKGKKQLIVEAAGITLINQRAMDRQKAIDKFQSERNKLAKLELELDKLIKDNNLQHYQFKSNIQP